jgi:hypothetical protein
MSDGLVVVLAVIATVSLFVAWDRWWRHTPSSSLRDTVGDLADQVHGFSKRIRELETEAMANRAEIASLLNEQSLLRHDFSELAAGAARLIDQLLAVGMTPVWFIPKRFMKRTEKSSRSRPLADLHVLMQEKFDDGELEELAFEMGVTWGQLEGNRTGLKVIALILMMNRQGRIGELLELLRDKRPLAHWPVVD